MDLVIFENNKPYIINEFREGRFDYIELASDVAETKFFQFLFDKGVVEKLASEYPSPRVRHHVDLWMYVSSQLSMRLHGSNSFHSYPFVIRSGGLIDALGPDMARREYDTNSGNMSIWCAGFNERNLYPRTTPCDQDYLRKMARDTDAELLQEWYNRKAIAIYHELDAFNSDGIFLGDGSYLFVPDNERYEGSIRLLFDENNHPVSKEQQKKMTPAQRQRCRWRRCYRAVFLLHCDWPGERFVVAGLRVMRADQSEAKALWELVDTFIETVGTDVMKVLVVDRGFIDGEKIGQLKLDYNIDCVIPIRSDMDILEDARGLAKLISEWEEYEAPSRSSLNTPKGKHPTAQKREKARKRTIAKRKAKTEKPTDPSKVVERTMIARIPDLTSWQACPVPLTGVLSRDIYADRHETSWLLVTTSQNWSATHTRNVYALRTDIEERHRQVKCFWDLTRFHSTAWNVVVSQSVFVALTYSLLQIHLVKHGHEILNRHTWQTAHQLLPDGDRVIIYNQQYFAFFTLMEHTEMAMRLEGKARRRAIAKVRRLQKQGPPA